MDLCRQFATFDDIVAASLRAIAGATTLPPGLIADLTGPFIETLPSPRDQARLLGRSFAGVDWRWPWFEEWAERFRALGLTPHMWDHARERLTSRTVRAEDVDIRPITLGHTVVGIAYAAQRIAGWARIDDGRLSSEWQHRWPRIEVVPGCSAEDLAAREAWPAIREGDLRTLPPFFPGDRTHFTVRNDRNMRRYGWTGPEWLDPPTTPLQPAAFDDVLDGLARGEWHRASFPGAVQWHESDSTPPPPASQAFRMNPEFLAFLQDRCDVGPAGPTISWFSAGEVLEWLWPLNALFTPHIARIRATPYDEAAEEECDGAIMAYALDPRAETLAPLSPAGWRVLYDRHETALAVVGLKDGEPAFIQLPLELPAQDRAAAVMLAVYLRRPRSELLAAR